MRDRLGYVLSVEQSAKYCLMEQVRTSVGRIEERVRERNKTADINLKDKPLHC